MRKFVEENERIKRKYLNYLKQAKGQDQKTLDKVVAAILTFEKSTNFKPFKKFHIEQAAKFKTHLTKKKNQRTGKPISPSTNDATLRLVKSFFHWLAGQSGFKSRISYSDVEYFNNNAKQSRIAHTQREIAYPSMAQCLHAFTQMPNNSDIEMRDKALFAFLMLTGARDGAIASLKLKHIDLIEGCVYQDARDVCTKNAKTFTSFFLPVELCYRECFETWVNYLRDQRLFGPDDALFPKPNMGTAEAGGFQVMGLSRQSYANATRVRQVIKSAFINAALPSFAPHSFRKTLVLYGSEKCQTMEAMKAWSLNLGHENLATTVSSYMPVTLQRQRDIIRQLSNG